MSKPRLLDAYTPESSNIRAKNTDFAEVCEWSDGNPSNANRIGYFVTVDTAIVGPNMKIANTSSEIRGVTVANPGFSTNATPDKFDSTGSLLPKYSFVGFLGFIPVIDNGTCTVGERCKAGADGTAVPGDSYQVAERIDATHVMIDIKSSGGGSTGGVQFSVVNGILTATYEED